MTAKQVFFIVLITFITVVAWVVFDILHSRAEVRPTPQVQELLEPVDPNFDTSGMM